MTAFRLRLLTALLALTVAGAAFAQSLLGVTVYKSPYCGCCHLWIEHLQKSGFQVSAKDVNDTGAERKRLGMPEKLGSCHTATVSGYVIEGHVPAREVKRLLEERPDAIGLTVPDMPYGSPGMGDTANADLYDVLLVKRDGSTEVFARYP